MTITSRTGELDRDDRDDAAIEVAIVELSELDLARGEEAMRAAHELRTATRRYVALAARPRSIAAWAAMQTRLSLARFDALSSGALRKRNADQSLTDEYSYLSAQLSDVAWRLSQARYGGDQERARRSWASPEPEPDRRGA